MGPTLTAVSLPRAKPLTRESLASSVLVSMQWSERLQSPTELQMGYLSQDRVLATKASIAKVSSANSTLVHILTFRWLRNTDGTMPGLAKGLEARRPEDQTPSRARFSLRVRRRLVGTARCLKVTTFTVHSSFLLAGLNWSEFRPSQTDLHRPPLLPPVWAISLPIRLAIATTHS